jgi:hypothetical protein
MVERPRVGDGRWEVVEPVLWRQGHPEPAGEVGHAEKPEHRYHPARAFFLLNRCAHVVPLPGAASTRSGRPAAFFEEDRSLPSADRWDDRDLRTVNNGCLKTACVADIFVTNEYVDVLPDLSLLS